MVFGVWCLVFGLKGFGFRVWGSKCRIERLRFGVHGWWVTGMPVGLQHFNVKEGGARERRGGRGGEERRGTERGGRRRAR